MLDLGFLMYGGLLLLALWRSIFFFGCCGMWLSFLNYTSLLYLMLSASLVYCSMEFYKHLSDPLAVSLNSDADIWNIPWLRPFILGSPVAVFFTVILCWFQTEAHVFEIHKDQATLKHDRAVQIIALPSVFAVMAMASMVDSIGEHRQQLRFHPTTGVPIYELVTGTISTEMMKFPLGVDIRNRFAKVTFQSTHEEQTHNQSEYLDLSTHTLSALEVESKYIDGVNSTKGTVTLTNISFAPDSSTNSSEWQEAMEYAVWRYETCFYVGDLFEAWSLYQFGLLALELIKESFSKQQVSVSQAERKAAEDMLAAHSAVSSLAWLGTMSFVLVCVGQTACALYPYLVGSMESGQNATDSILLGFQVAGFIASGVAIYNVFIVERCFHHHLEPSSPLLKFLSVKILVSLSFFQRGILVILQEGNKMMPQMAQKIVGYLPFLGQIINMTEVQIHLFYPALILYECFFTTLLHFWAWSAEEDWYSDGNLDIDPERQPLLKDAAAGPSYLMAAPPPGPQPEGDNGTTTTTTTTTTTLRPAEAA